jgi:hypothetical protein
VWVAKSAQVKLHGSRRHVSAKRGEAATNGSASTSVLTQPSSHFEAAETIVPSIFGMTYDRGLSLIRAKLIAKVVIVELQMLVAKEVMP